MSKKIKENGIEVDVQDHHDKPGRAKTFYNPLMSICREFALVALAAAVDNAEMPWKCLDAFAATGIAGLLWKHHLKDKVQVTINELSPESFAQIQRNCAANGINYTLQPPSSDGPSVEVPVEELVKSPVELVNSDANVVMHQRQFHFIHLDPYGTTVQFLDAAFRNCYNKGIVVVTSTDVAALYGKCPQVTLRNYDASTVKTDYTKEIAARLVLAAVCRTAARCSKGIEVLYCVAVEHFVQVAVRICRGPKHADACMPLIRRVLHCQMCEDWATYPDTRAPIEQPYDLLPCSCHKEIPGKTAVELGPMWCGDLYSTSFLQIMQQCCNRLKLSERLKTLLETMASEAVCSWSPKPQAPSNLSENTSVLKTDSKSDEEKSSDAANVPTIHAEDTINNDTECDKNTASNVPNSTAENGGVICRNSEKPLKRKLPLNVEASNSSKRARTMRNVADDRMPQFFYNVHRRKVKGVDLPKAQKLVVLLHREGHRASRTHFEPMGIRTDATLNQLKAILMKHCSNV